MEKSMKMKSNIVQSQTLLRGLDVLETVLGGKATIADLSATLGLSRSTTHRIASALVERQYLKFVPRQGYSLGAKLLQLSSIAHSSIDLVQVSRPFLQQLAILTCDTVCLGVLDSWRAMYLDRISGGRRIAVSTRIGERHSVISTALGKALILNASIEKWREFFQYEVSQGRVDAAALPKWISSMQDCARRGYAFDLQENREQIRCVAAPIWSADRDIVGAISVTSASQYMDDLRIRRLSIDVKQTAEAISRELGWAGHTSQDNPAKAHTSRPTEH
jgi:DNA-binding IclR family transcriptional regulator